MTNRMISLMLGLLIAFGNDFLYAQTRLIEGTVFDERGNSLAWVNIGIRNKEVGTVSNDSGIFKLAIPAQLLEDSVVFSFVGFHEQTYPVKDLVQMKQNRITLTKKAIVLSEVVISSEKRRKARLGTRGYTPMIWMGVSIRGSNDYAEPAQLIKLKQAAQILSANVRVGGNKRSKDSLTYRLNIYKAQNGIPGERLIEKSFIKTFPETSEILSFDLKEHSIHIEQDFFVAFEYINKEGSAKKKALSFRASLGGTGGFSRMASFGKWLPILGGAAASIFVEVEY